MNRKQALSKGHVMSCHVIKGPQGSFPLFNILRGNVVPSVMFKDSQTVCFLFDFLKSADR